MNKKYQIIAAFFIVIGILFIFRSKSNEKINMLDRENKAHQRLNAESESYQQDVEEYRIKAAEQIEENEKSVLEFNKIIANQKSDAKAKYEKKIAELNRKNSDMKKKIDDFRTDNKNHWEAFRKEFSHDMEELGNAFKGFSVKNEEKE